MKKQIGLAMFEMDSNMNGASITVNGGTVTVPPKYVVKVLESLLYNIDYNKLMGRVQSYFLANYKIMNLEALTDDGGVILCKLALDNTARTQLIEAMTTVLRGMDQFMLLEKSDGFDKYNQIQSILENDVMNVEGMMN